MILGFATKVLLVCGVLIIVLGVVMAHKKKCHTRKTLSQCASAHGEDIAVLIYAHNQREQAAETICSLFSRAYCPLRVHVRLVDGIDNSALPTFLSILQKNRDAVPASLLTCLMSNVTILTQDRATQESLGPVNAYHRLSHSTVEDYTLICSPGDVFTPDWDKNLLQQSTSEKRVCAWTPVVRQLESGSSAPHTTGAVGAIFGQLQSNTVQEQENFTAHNRSSFTVIERVRGYIPVMQPRLAPAHFSTAVQQLGGTRFFCGTALLKRAFRSSPELCSIPCASYAAPWVLCSMLYHVGGDFRTTTHNVSLRSEKQSTFKPTDWSGQQLNRLLKKHGSAYAEYAAFDLESSTLYGRGRLGIVDTNNLSEIILKYSSLDAFNRAKNMVT